MFDFCFSVYIITNFLQTNTFSVGKGSQTGAEVKEQIIDEFPLKTLLPGSIQEAVS